MDPIRFYFFVLLLLQLGCTTEVDTTEPIEDNPVVLDLAGQWNTHCLTTDYGSYHLRVSVEGDYFTYTETHFDEGDCPPGFEYIQIHQTFLASGAAMMEEPENAKSLNLKLMWVSTRSHRPDLIAQWNKQSNCGHREWRLNELHYATGNTCIWPHETVEYGEFGAVMFDIYKLEGSPAKLSLGNDPNSQLRPTKFDERLQFFRIEK